MPVIVIEGPDESGKTTLAEALYEHLRPTMEADVELQRSPIKELGWQRGHRSYLHDLSLGVNHLIIQDRVPEISEAVYGAIRGHTRGRGYMYEAYTWLQHPICMVFCEGPFRLTEDHADTTDRPITQEDHEVSCMMYRHIAFNLRQMSIFAGTANFRVFEYSRFNPNQQAMYGISEWLSQQMPDYDEVAQTLCQ